MKSNSDSETPAPSDDESHRSDEALEKFGDDESIDLGDLEPVEEGASALSFSGGSEGRKGGSSSVIRSWEQLVRESGADSDVDEINYDATNSANEFDAASDKELLKEVLADEPAPSDIRLKDPSSPEMPTLPELPMRFTDPECALGDVASVPVTQPTSGSGIRPAGDSGRFALPPDLAATKPSDPPSSAKIPRSALPKGAGSPGDSSVLGEGSIPEPGQSGVTSDVWGSGSRVDLTRPGQTSQSFEVSSGSLERTDEMDAPRGHPLSGNSSSTWLGDALTDGAESSAVDLGSQGFVDLPFPLGADSSTGSSLLGGKRPFQPLSKPDPDSGTIDLLSSSEEFGVSMPESTTTPSWAEAREDMPPTVPMVPAGRARLLALVGGGIGGLVLGVAACAGLWFAGVIPGKSTTTEAPTRPDSDAALARLRAENETLVKAEQKKATDAAAKAQSETTALENIKQQLKQAGLDASALAGVSQQLADGKTAAAQAKELRERAEAMAAQSRASEAEAKDSMQKLAEANAASDAKLRESNARIAALNDKVAKSDATIGQLKEQIDRALAARTQSAALAAEIAKRLNEAPQASSDELLSALDRALTRSTSTATNPSYPPIYSPQQAHRAERAGFAALRESDPARAEQEFARLAKSPDGNAIHFYFLGLSQWHQGRTAEAEQSFRRGWTLERDSHPPPSAVQAAFERLSQSDRVLVNSFRR